jgi:outer membrane protein assembly factor BamB
VHALDPASGRELWSFGARAAVDSSPVILGGRVLVASKAGEIVLLDGRSGAQLWRFDAGAPVEASPAYGFGRLVVGTMDGSLHAFVPAG